MKKLTSVVLAILMVANFSIFAVGCNKDKDSDKDSKKTERTEKEDETTPDETDATEESASEAGTTKPAKKPSGNDKDAYEDALIYLDMTGFSRQGLIDQLTSEWGGGYSLEDATMAVNVIEANGEVDWNEQAVMAALNYAESMNYSEKTVLEELKSDMAGQFTKEQAEYAINYINENKLVDWDEIAFEAAKVSLESMAYSRDGLIANLEGEYDGNFTHDQAVRAVERIESEEHIDWNEQAYRCAMEYMEYFDMPKDELYDQLTSEYGDMFTKEQADYAMSKIK